MAGDADCERGLYELKMVLRFIFPTMRIRRTPLKEPHIGHIAHQDDIESWHMNGTAVLWKGRQLFMGG